MILSKLLRSPRTRLWIFRHYSSKCTPKTDTGCVPDPCKDLRKSKMDVLCKVAIVTGGGSGIGYAAANEILSNGAKAVVIAEPDETHGKKAAKCLCDNFGLNKAIYLPCDVRCPKQLEDTFRYTQCMFKRIDIVLNNAGVIDDRNWEKSTQINVLGAIRGILLANKYMEGKEGVVINTCATAGLMPWPNCPVFAAGKHAVVAACRCLGDSFHTNKSKVRIMGLCPGFTNTPNWDKAVWKHLEDQWGAETLKCIKSIPLQSPTLVGRAVMHLIKYGDSGSIYVCEHGVLYKTVYPKTDELLSEESVCA